MKDTKQRIIELLKMNGELTAAELSQVLGVSTTAVRRHLTSLEERSLVRHRAEQRGMGRPSFVYVLTESTPKVFAQSFDSFVRSILNDLGGLDGYLKPDEVFVQRQEQRHQKYISLTKGETLPARVASLARLMEIEGRMTTWQCLSENQFILREHNCAFHRFNEKFDFPCRCEASLLQKALQAKVKRINHIFAGDVACVYLIEGTANGKTLAVEERGHMTIHTAAS